MNETVTVDWTKTTVEQEVEKLIMRYLTLSDAVADLVIDKAERELNK